MQIDILIIGQGISGTCLSYYLSQENVSFLIIDDERKNAPSRVAAGIINPVTGRRIVRTWIIEELLPYTWNFYTQLGNELGIHSISEKKIIDFFPSPQMKIAFDERLNEGETYLQKTVDENIFREQFNYDFGFGSISPAYTVHLENILPAWRKKMIDNNNLLEEEFDFSQLKISGNRVEYKNITAKQIIFCDGVQSYQNPYFNKLPFAPNKGEMLIVEILGLSNDYLYKKGMTLAPLATKDFFWLGSNYLWEFDTENTSEVFYKQADAFLKSWLKVPYKIIDHKVSIRPATLERRPFVGFHPIYPSVGILNGMGTKGCSLAPYFARQLADNIIYKKSISPESDITRFKRILSA
jgi:glycine/D-amino acid oxidase-like deaminating enzyme